MAIGTYLIPTKNLQNFNAPYIYEILKKKFKWDYEVALSLNGVYPSITLSVINPKEEFLYGGIIAILYTNYQCDLVDFDNIDELTNKGIETNNRKLLFLSDELRKLREVKPDLNNCIGSIGGNPNYIDDKTKIEFYLKDIFGIYIFNDRISPEFIPPSEKLDNSPAILKFAKWVYQDIKKLNAKSKLGK